MINDIDFGISCTKKCSSYDYMHPMLTKHHITILQVFNPECPNAIILTNFLPFS